MLKAFQPLRDCKQPVTFCKHYESLPSGSQVSYCDETNMFLCVDCTLNHGIDLFQFRLIQRNS